MRFKTLRRWQWVAIGILVGSAVGLASLQMGGVGSTPVGMSQEEFERLLVTPPALGEYPALDEVTVVPVDGVYWVRAMRRYPLADGSGFEYRARWLALRGRRYQPLAGSDHGSDYTVRDFLADAALAHPGVKYRYAWERDARVALPACALGGALLIGVIWPWTLGVRAGAEPETDRSRLAGAQADREAHAGPSDEERLRLLTLEEEMEARLRASPECPQVAPPRATPPAVARLDDAHISAAAPPVRETKEYGGEFYPTETHAGQKSS
jgi:hypothetical protein